MTAVFCRHLWCESAYNRRFGQSQAIVSGIKPAPKVFNYIILRAYARYAASGYYVERNDDRARQTVYISDIH